MDDTTQSLFTTDPTHNGIINTDGGGKDEEENERVWETLNTGFNEVQKVLDQNRNLIQQANDNHQSMIPRNLCKNVELIREINGNISRVIALYANLTSSFTNAVQERRGSKDVIREADATNN